MITKETITTMNPKHPQPEILAKKLWWACQKFNITTEPRVFHLLAQLTHESGLVPKQENLWYSTRRLMQVWPGRFPTWYSAVPYSYNPFLLANKVYGGRMGNYRWDDGYRYRGRGLIQITGRSNYRFYGGILGYGLQKWPDLCLQYGISSLVACAYWSENNLNDKAEAGDIAAITRAINGGYNGLAHRRQLLQRLKKYYA